MRKPNTNCFECNKPLYRRPCEFLIRKVFYCKKCQNLYMNNVVKIKNDKTYIKFISDWKLGLVNGMRGKYQISLHIKRFLFEKYNNKCCECGWHEINKYTNKIPLEIEHIDGNYKNNNEEKLIIIT